MTFSRVSIPRIKKQCPFLLEKMLSCSVVIAVCCYVLCKMHEEKGSPLPHLPNQDICHVLCRGQENAPPPPPLQPAPCFVHPNIQLLLKTWPPARQSVGQCHNAAHPPEFPFFSPQLSSSLTPINLCPAPLLPHPALLLSFGIPRVAHPGLLRIYNLPCPALP